MERKIQAYFRRSGQVASNFVEKCSYVLWKSCMQIIIKIVRRIQDACADAIFFREKIKNVPTKEIVRLIAITCIAGLRVELKIIVKSLTCRCNNLALVVFLTHIRAALTCVLTIFLMGSCLHIIQVNYFLCLSIKIHSKFVLYLIYNSTTRFACVSH